MPAVLNINEWDRSANSGHFHILTVVNRLHLGSKRGSLLTKQGVEMKFHEAGWQCYAHHLPKNECLFKWTLNSGSIGATALPFTITQSVTAIQSRRHWMSRK